MMAGSITGGKLITYGRIKVLRGAAFTGIVGTTLTIMVTKNDLQLSIKLLLIGRFTYGFGTALIAVAMPRFIEEILPSERLGLFSGIYCFSFAIATIIAYLLALGLPDDKDQNGEVNVIKLK